MKLKNVCIITSPFLLRASLPPLSNLVTIISSFTQELYVITGGSGKDLWSNSEVHIIEINYDPGSTIVSKISSFILAQINIVSYLISLNNIDTCIFFMGERTLTLPLIVSKILKKKIFYMSSGSLIKPFGTRKTVCSEIMKIFECINHFFSDNIILYSNKLISMNDYVKFKDKILIAHEHFLDFDTFTITTPLSHRPPYIGYIGRMSEEKGIQHFAQALSAILDGRQDLRVLIGGDGPLREAVESSLQEVGLTSRVDLLGWISHDDLPKYLNQLSLLVLPSYTEGLPNIMLEAMACGTPVLATAVGTIPDVIIDGKTGFIMENNSAECITENVIRALNSPEREQIAENGKQFVEGEFTFENTVEEWEKILEKI